MCAYRKIGRLLEGERGRERDFREVEVERWAGDAEEERLRCAGGWRQRTALRFSGCRTQGVGCRRRPECAGEWRRLTTLRCAPPVKAPRIYLSIYLSVCISFYLSVYLSIYICGQNAQGRGGGSQHSGSLGIDCRVQGRGFGLLGGERPSSVPGSLLAKLAGQ